MVRMSKLTFNAVASAVCDAQRRPFTHKLNMSLSTPSLASTSSSTSASSTTRTRLSPSPALCNFSAPVTRATSLSSTSHSKSSRARLADSQRALRVWVLCPQTSLSRVSSRGLASPASMSCPLILWNKKSRCASSAASPSSFLQTRPARPLCPSCFAGARSRTTAACSRTKGMTCFPLVSPPTSLILATS